MSEDILVVEYEPRYTDRVRQALAGQPFTPHFARDGEEALRSLANQRPRLIVVSSMLPRINTADLIRQIRIRPEHRETPILVTISGYNGKTPKTDAVRFGATDLLPKPYSEGEFLIKVHELLGSGDVSAQKIPSEHGLSMPPEDKSQQVTSDQLFGEMVDEEKGGPPQRKAKASATSNVDKLLADTLSGIRVPTKKTLESERPTTSAEAKEKQRADLDQLLHDTLSGRDRPKKSSEPPAGAKPSTPPTAALPEDESAPRDEDVLVASPVLASKTEPLPLVEEHDSTDPNRFGQYTLIDRIASGGMAEVWKARMRGVEGFEKVVAIKKILPHLSDNEEFVTMFIDEAKLAAQLNHSNIIHIYDLGRIGASYYIAMEYIDGADLKTILKLGEERAHPLSIDLALFIASKIGSALDYAHRKRDLHEVDMGLVHRDVSPQNVLISHEGDIKLCDFGIAKAASKASQTQAGALKGKLQYMSPEQAWGRHIDRRSDVFALAIVLFEMLVGRKLFSGDNEISILEQVREARVVPPSQFNDDVTPQIDAIVLKALHKEPQARYQTAGEMAKDLDSVLYTFRPTPTSADLAIHMHRLFTSEPIAHAPAQTDEAPPGKVVPVASPAPRVLHISTPSLVPETPAAPMQTPLHTPAKAIDHEPSFARAVVDEPKRSKAVPIAIVAVLVAGLAVAGWFVMKEKPPNAPQPGVRQVDGATSRAVPQPVPTPADSLTTAAPGETLTSGAIATETQAPGAGDQALIDEEVKRRLATERTRLEQQRAQQSAAEERSRQAASTPAPQQSAPVPTATVAQQPVQEPAPPPVAAPVPETREEPEPAQRSVKEGDLVDASTSGLIPAELISLRKPLYPQIAKMRKVEGIVVLSVLVSEAGRVLEVKLLRGVAQNVGINEAAVDAARSGANFRPATKDGVRVKSWKTITIPFKL